MKLWVFLVLTLFVGCQCKRDALNKKHKKNLELKKDDFWEYITKALNTHGPSLQNIGQMELGQEITAKVSHTVDAVNQFIETLHSQVTPLTQDLLAKLSQEAEQLKSRLEQDLSSIQAQLGPYAEELRLELERQVEELKWDVRPHREVLQSEALRATVLQTAEEMTAGLDKTVTELQAALESEANDMKQKMDQYLEELRESTVPMVEKLKSQISEASQGFQQTLVNFGVELGENLKNQFLSFWQSLTKTS